MRYLSKLSLAALLGFALVGPHAADAQPKKKDAKGGEVEMEADNVQSGPPSKTLERAIKLYDKKDFFSASIELKKVLDG